MDEAGTLKGASRRYILSAIEASLKREVLEYFRLLGSQLVFGNILDARACSGIGVASKLFGQQEF